MKINLSQENGKLFLIPNFLGEDTDATKIFPSFNAKIIHEIKFFIIESHAAAKRLLKKIDYPHPFDQAQFYLLNEHEGEDQLQPFILKAKEGNNIGLISDAGIPAIADPGASAVAIAHKQSIQVVPLVGPSSIFLALMASGLNGQNFTFNGYLPVKPIDRAKAIKNLENKIITQNQTQIFIEAPYRNIQLFESIVKTCLPTTALCIATNLTQPNETIITKTIKQWKNLKPNIHKENTIFILGKLI